MNKENLYAFYGSLRKGMYNYRAFSSNMDYLETVVVTGFKLFSLGAYPCAIKTGNEDDKLTVDLFKVTGEDEHRIDRMEKGASYKYDELEFNGKKFGIYVFPSDALNRLSDRNVPEGDWVKFLHPTNEERTV